MKRLPCIPQHLPLKTLDWARLVPAIGKALVHLAILFAQLLILHPFMDGNGRVGRIWIPIFLWKKKVISKPYFFLSAYFGQNQSLYFQKLFRISENGDWEGWILYFLQGVMEQVDRRYRPT